MSGPYTSTYNAVAIGLTEDGYNLQQDSHGQDIAQSDLYGDTVIDSIYRGGSVFLDFSCMGYKAGTITPFWPFGALGVLGTVGRLASNLAAATVMTAVAGTPAAAAPASLTATLSLLPNGSSQRLLYSSKLRTVPVRLRVLPVDVGSGVIKWFTMT